LALDTEEGGGKMTIKEAQICAKLFAEEKRGVVPDNTIDEVRFLLNEACEHFPETIAKIEPNKMEELFTFFRALIVRLAIEELIEGLGLDAVIVMAEFRQEFVNGGEPELPPEEEKRFRGLIGKLDLHEE